MTVKSSQPARQPGDRETMAAWNQRLSSLTDRAWSAVLSVRIRHNVQSDRLNPVDRRGPVIGSLLGVVPRCRIRPNPPPEPRMVSLLTHRTACVVALLGVAATAGAQSKRPMTIMDIMDLK